MKSTFLNASAYLFASPVFKAVVEAAGAGAHTMLLACNPSEACAAA